MLSLPDLDAFGCGGDELVEHVRLPRPGDLHVGLRQPVLHEAEPFEHALRPVVVHQRLGLYPMKPQIVYQLLTPTPERVVTYG